MSSVILVNLSRTNVSDNFIGFNTRSGIGYSSPLIVILEIEYPLPDWTTISFFESEYISTSSYGAWPSPEMLPPPLLDVVILNFFHLFSITISDFGGCSGESKCKSNLWFACPSYLSEYSIDPSALTLILNAVW